MTTETKPNPAGGMRPAFTPGPWRHRQTYHNGEPSGFVVDAGRHFIADLSSTALDRPEEEANARLIAEAPELLATFEHLLAELRRSRFKFNVRKDYSLMVAEVCATKAIRKARGEE